MSNTNFVRYDAYKNSGVEWLGEVPAHWENGRMKDFVNTNAATKVPISLADNDLVEFIPMSNVDDLLGKIKKFNFVPFKEVFTGYTKFKNGDVIFAKITPCMENGKSAIVSSLSNNIGYGSTEFMVFRAFKKLSKKYLHYYLHNDLFRRNAEPFMRGTAGQKRITSYFMATHFFTSPPLPEQTTIAAYLDTKTAHIDRKIDLLSQKAVQYGMLKQSLINETVTRSLDKTVAMKDSGVDWIGEVPKHWEVKRLKENVKLFHGYSFSEQDFSKNISDNFLVKITELQNNKVSLKKNSAMLKNNPAFEKYRIKKNEMLIALSGATAGKISIFDLDDKCYLNQRVAKIKGSKNYNYKFLFYFLNRQQIVDIMYALSNITAQPNFNNNILFINCLTPPLSEQQAIADYLDEKTTHIDRIVETINTQLDKLKELRNTLINDVVTGKIKVMK